MTSLDKLAADIRVEHEACEQHAKSAVEHAIKAGEKLIEAKAQVAHGEWLPWLSENFKFTRQHAARYMRIAQHADEMEHAGSISEALAILAEPKQTAFVEATPEIIDALKRKLDTHRPQPTPAIKPAIRPTYITETPVEVPPQCEPDPAEQRQSRVDGARVLISLAQSSLERLAADGFTADELLVLGPDVLALVNEFAALTNTPVDWDAEFGALLSEENN